MYNESNKSKCFSGASIWYVQSSSWAATNIHFFCYSVNSFVPIGTVFIVAIVLLIVVHTMGKLELHSSVDNLFLYRVMPTCKTTVDLIPKNSKGSSLMFVVFSFSVFSDSIFGVVMMQPNTDPFGWDSHSLLNECTFLGVRAVKHHK